MSINAMAAIARDVNPYSILSSALHILIHITATLPE
jgi:hypothetical protein